MPVAHAQEDSVLDEFAERGRVDGVEVETPSTVLPLSPVAALRVKKHISFVLDFLVIPASEGVVIVVSDASHSKFVDCIFEQPADLQRTEEIETGAGSELQQSIVVGEEYFSGRGDAREDCLLGVGQRELEFDFTRRTQMVLVIA